MKKTLITLLTILYICTIIPTHAEDIKLLSKYVSTYDYSSGQTLYRKNDTQKAFPASLTKIMTAYVGVLHIKDMNKKVKIRSLYNNKAASNGLVRSGIKDGEKVTYNDLLHAIIFKSGAESCYALADTLFGSEKNMVKEMNKIAKSIHMDHTHFTNNTGMHNDNHYTTTSDMILLMKTIWENDKMHQLFTESYYKTSNKKHTFKSVATRLRKAAGPYLLGAKTGVTNPAGQCFAGVSSIHNHIIFTVTMKINHTSGSYHAKDTNKMNTYIVNHYKSMDIAYSNQPLSHVLHTTYTPFLTNSLENKSILIPKDYDEKNFTYRYIDENSHPQGTLATINILYKQEYYDSVDVILDKKTVPLESLEVPDHLELTQNQEVSLDIKKTPSDTTEQLIYTSSNEELLKINSDGIIRTYKPGDVIITIKGKTIEKTISVHITEAKDIFSILFIH